jgi:uncharacterized protein (DUF1499 family)
MLEKSRVLLAPEPTPKSATWSLRIAAFCMAVLITGLFLHRLFALPTPVALNLVKLAILGGFVALLLAVFAFFRIWSTGCPGGTKIVISGLVSLGLVTWPLVHLPTVNALPEINDISTDLEDPPSFEVLAKRRPADANDAVYPGETFAKQQKEAYPDLKPVLINRSSEEVFEIAREALRRQRLEVVRADAPGKSVNQPGHIEAVDRTLVLGFYDDVVIRIVGDTRSAWLDIRSASRYGRHDLGRNAKRIRRLLREINARLEATVPTVS